MVYLYRPEELLDILIEIIEISNITKTSFNKIIAQHINRYLETNNARIRINTYGHCIALRNHGCNIFLNSETNISVEGDFIAVYIVYKGYIILKRNGSLLFKSHYKNKRHDLIEGIFTPYNITSNGLHNVAGLRKNGSIVEFCDKSTLSLLEKNMHKIDYKTISIIEAVDNNCMILLKDGSIIMLGDNRHRLLDVPKGHDFTTIAMSSRTAIALRRDGSIVSWGDTPANLRTPIEKGYIAIACSDDICMALHMNGTIRTWGNLVLLYNPLPHDKKYTAISVSNPYISAISNNDEILVVKELDFTYILKI